MGLFQWLKKNDAKLQRPTVHIPDGPDTPRVRKSFRFSGVVQAVGFRYEARMLAARLGLTGWVRNNSDGSVTVEVEGGATRVDAFLRAIQAVPRFVITQIQMEDLPLSEAETAFQVRY